MGWNRFKFVTLYQFYRPIYCNKENIVINCINSESIFIAYFLVEAEREEGVKYFYRDLIQFRAYNLMDKFRNLWKTFLSR